MSFQPIEVADDKDILVFHDILGQEGGSAQPTPTTETTAATGNNNLLAPSTSSRGQRATSPSEDSPLKDGQIGPRKPSVECCGFGIGAVVLVSSAMTLAFSLTLGLILSIRFGPPQIPPSGSVISPSSECSNIGLKLLKDRSASAADAAIAMALCAGIVRAESSGLGGDGFAIYHDHRRSAQFVFNGRSCAPNNVAPLTAAFAGANGTADFSKYRLSGWAVAIPSELALFWHLHKRRGKLSWPEVIQPVIDMAKTGFQLTPETVAILKSPAVNLSELAAKSPNIASLYLNMKDLSVLPVGTVIKRPDLADLLTRIAASMHEYRYFYEGDPARNITAKINQFSPGNQGLFSSSNLTSNCTLLTEQMPLNSSFKEFTLLYPGLPSAGITVAEILGILSQSNFTKLAVSKDSADIHNILAEATKHSFADLYQSTPDTLDMLTNSSYWQLISSQIETMSVPSTWGAYARKDKQLQPLPAAETTGNFVAALDENEGFVALTLSLGSPFGSMIATDDGVILNNHMEAFYYDPSLAAHPNAVGPGKQPWSVQAPIIAHVPQSCKVRLAVGTVPFLPPPLTSNQSSTSGWHVVPHLAEVLTRLLGGSRETAASAVRRWRYSPLPLIGDPTTLIVEGNVNASDYVSPAPAILDGFKSHGQNVVQTQSPLSIAGIVSKEADKINDTPDPRSESAVALHF